MAESDYIEITIRYPKDTHVLDIASDMATLDRRLQVLPDTRFVTKDNPNGLCLVAVESPKRMSMLLRPQAG